MKSTCKNLRCSVVTCSPAFVPSVACCLPSQCRSSRSCPVTYYICICVLLCFCICSVTVLLKCFDCLLTADCSLDVSFRFLVSLFCACRAAASLLRSLRCSCALSASLLRCSLAVYVGIASFSVLLLHAVAPHSVLSALLCAVLCCVGGCSSPVALSFCAAGVFTDAGCNSVTHGNEFSALQWLCEYVCEVALGRAESSD